MAVKNVVQLQEEGGRRRRGEGKGGKGGGGRGKMSVSPYGLRECISYNIYTDIHIMTAIHYICVPA